MNKRIGIINIDRAKFYLLYLFMFLIFLIPPACEKLMSSSTYRFIKITSYFFILIYIILNFKKINHSLLLMLGFNFILVLSTFLNKGEITESIKHAVTILIICLILVDVIDNNIKRISFIYVIRDLTLLFFIINLFMIILYPAGIPSITYDSQFPNYLYGNVNSTIKHILPGMCCSSLLDFRKNKKVSFYTFIFIFGIFYQALFIYFTATAVLNCLFILFWIHIFCFSNKYNIRKVYLISITLIFIIEIMLVSRLKVVSLISNIFGKDFTFSGRIYLWDNVINLITKKLFVGYGVIDESLEVYLIGNFYGSHNYFLDILFQRGIIGLIFLITIMIYPLLVNFEFEKQKYINLLFGYSISCFILFLTEPIYNKEYLILPIIFSLIYSIEKSKNINLKSRIE